MDKKLKRKEHGLEKKQTKGIVYIKGEKLFSRKGNLYQKENKIKHKYRRKKI